MKLALLCFVGAIFMMVAEAAPTSFFAGYDAEEAAIRSIDNDGAYKLHLFDDAKAPDGPVCLDGTPAGVYLYRSENPETQNKFIIFFEGGGWCSSPEDCKNRAGTKLGSSTNWTSTIGAGGLMSLDCDVNPQFCDWTRIYLPYCDGNSFTGDRAEPLVVGGTPIHFRGARITEHALSWAVDNYGLGNATEVMLSGCSAGGLASILNANRVGSFLSKHAPQLGRYKVVPLSGVFLDEPSVEGRHLYGEMIRGVVEMTQPRYTLAEDGPDAVDPCLKAHSDDPAACHFGKTYLPHVIAPAFLFNSLIDSWQLSCVLTVSKKGCGRAAGWGNCAKNIGKCSAEQFGAVRSFALAQTHSLPDPTASGALTTAPSAGTGDHGSIAALARRFMAELDAQGGWKVGALFHTCRTHCEAANNHMWANFKTEEGVPMREVIKFFWRQNDDSAPWRWYPCEFKADAPYQCNPTCPSDD